MKCRSMGNGRVNKKEFKNLIAKNRNLYYNALRQEIQSINDRPMRISNTKFESDIPKAKGKLREKPKKVKPQKKKILNAVLIWRAKHCMHSLTQSFLDAKGNIFIKRRKRKSQELLTGVVPKQGKIVCLSSKLLKLSRLNKMLLVLIVVCICIFYANLDHLVRANFAFLLPSSVSISGALNTTRKPIEINEETDLSQESLTSLAQQAKPLKFLQQHQQQHLLHHEQHNNINHIGIKANDYNIFVIYTKENYQLHAKFELFIRSLLKHASIPMHLHVITDKISKSSVEEIIMQHIKRFRHTMLYTLYDIQACAEQLVDIVSTMRPYFSATPKSYYGDALFYLSLGLHRIADAHLDRVVLLDCDIVFRSDVRQLFAEFEHFSEEHLFGLAPELTPVYRHILYRYRANYPGTNFGNPYYPLRRVTTLNDENNKNNLGVSLEEKMRLKRRIKHGYPGLNSGVVLLRLERIRSSQLYNEQLTSNEVQRLTSKYTFRGHLGDQDFFTLFGYELPHLVYRLDCVWNRQLCTWWKNHGYSEVFDTYFHCVGRIRMYHGNCNTRVPE